jgi:hypothetical protein
MDPTDPDTPRVRIRDEGSLIVGKVTTVQHRAVALYTAAAR